MRVLSLALALPFLADAAGVFNVKDYGASGKKSEDARPAIQRAIDACAAVGGGVVRFPPGDYTSGTLHLRSHLRVEIEEGATLFASSDPNSFEFGNILSKAALFLGEGIEDITITGAGAVDGQAEYEWREDDFEQGFEHKTLMLQLGKPILRSFPKDFPKRQVFPHLIWLGRSREVRLTGLTLQRCPSWAVTLYGCERVLVDRLNIFSSLREAVWADGIDLDGCKDVVISNCRIETGDDCIALISGDVWGPARWCENITVSGCRLSTASAGVKFSEGNLVGLRQIVVRDTVLTNVNRGFAFNIAYGGQIRDVLLTNLSIHCNRFDWFWAGDGQPFTFRIGRLSEFNHEPARPNEKSPGAISNIVFSGIQASAKGTSLIRGHPESWLNGVRIENLKLALATDPTAPYDKAEHALDFRRVRNLALRGVEVTWKEPALAAWRSALYFEDVAGLELDSFAGRGAWLDRNVPTVVLTNVAGATVRNCRALDGTPVFLHVGGARNRDIKLQGNDLRAARMGWVLDNNVDTNAVRLLQ